MVCTIFSKSKNKITKSGYSLIEIMIVLLIIGVLSAVAFGGFRFLEKARMSNTNSKLAKLDADIEEYRTLIGDYPTDLQNLINGPQESSRKWSGPLATEADLKDAWGSQVVYELNPRGAQPPYELYAEHKGSKIHSPRTKEA